MVLGCLAPLNDNGSQRLDEGREDESSDFRLTRARPRPVSDGTQGVAKTIVHWCYAMLSD
jgi:hypothetical protein